MNYTLEHIKAAFRAGKKGLSEAGFLNYLEFHSLLAEDAPTVKHERKTRGPAKIKAPKARKKGKRAPKGHLGASILKFLSSKGKEGAHVKEIAQAIGTKASNVTAWFYTTATKLLTTKEIRKVKPNTFAYFPKTKP